MGYASRVLAIEEPVCKLRSRLGPCCRQGGAVVLSHRSPSRFILFTTNVSKTLSLQKNEQIRHCEGIEGFRPYRALERARTRAAALYGAVSSMPSHGQFLRAIARQLACLVLLSRAR